ncbi:MAG: aminotransferase class I/II-fold pyridoxal phosphate-dependent enzyme [Acidobacteriota bacterium]|nr:aminotransferase class I/II-fold pyridoxal phosphate-dependent enzyme [Acidobacteriota bacterium]
MTHKLATDAIHLGEGADPSANPLTVPIYETTTYVFKDAAEVEAFQAGKSDRYLYTRYGNPTVMAVEKKLAAIEGGEAALLLSSGMAAVSTAILSRVKAGDEVVCGSAIYGGTLHLLSDLLTRFGIRSRFVEPSAMSDPATYADTTTLAWFESPINPTLRCVDIAAVARACRARGVTSVIDSTFGTPINQRPLDLGVDIVMHSATKYLNGHGDITAGVLVGSADAMKDCAYARKMIGTVLDPAAAYAVGRGLKSLSARMAVHNANAMRLAEWLEKSGKVSRVYYPGLASHPDHAIATQQMPGGFGGMVCIDLDGDYQRVTRFYDRLQLFKRAASLGGTESLISLPVLTSQYGHTADQLAAAGVTRGMARLSVGIEDVDDLKSDLEQALAI